MRIQHSKFYSELLSEYENIVTPITPKETKHVFHLFVIRAEKRNQLKKHLNEHGIATGIHYPTPLPFLKAYDYLGYNPKDFPISYEYKDQILSLPMYPELDIAKIEYISKIINQFYSK